MKNHLYLFLFMIHFSTGCILSDKKQSTVITGYTGGSVVLPCSCADPQSTAKTFTWQFQRSVKQWIEVFEDEKYRGRLVLFNESSPKNLSLLISDLRIEDQGYYKCMTERHSITISIELTVKGCNLVQNTKSTDEVTGYAGESVVLPCSCAELLAKPEQIQWMYLIKETYWEIYPNEKTESHKKRVKLLNQTTSGNLSLHISALTAEHAGVYYCSVSSQQVTYTLHVEEKPHIYTPISLSIHQPSHQTQESTPPRPPHHTPQYIFILVAVFPLALILPFLALSSGYSKDEEASSAVVYVETASTPDHTLNVPVQLTEYVNTNAKLT
ncbi:polymeric immunoglobulin receptor-like [Megalobrama amblycephala]|uniref:polymeric immunoglobulin receptor-like n=1 Tax=Megalobrama amblycephala TaxID=75352 RepID=UPI0020141FB7|nr:polymeric immunoglobulin receptor-like [Megalobrama amblycephala]